MAFIEDHQKLVAILSVLIFILAQVCLFSYQLFILIREWKKWKLIETVLLPSTIEYEQSEEISLNEVIHFQPRASEEASGESLSEEMFHKNIGKSKIQKLRNYIKEKIIHSSIKEKIYLLIQLSLIIFVVYVLFKLHLLRKPLGYIGDWILTNPIFKSCQIIYDLFSGRKDIRDYVPLETDSNVYLGYTGMCILLLSIGLSQIKGKRYLWGGIHFFFSLISLSTILMMKFSNTYETRWHHMSYGLLLTMTDFNSLTIFGSYFVFDSMGYWFSFTSTSDFGYDNIIQKYTVFILVSLLSCILFQIVSTFILKKIRDKYKIKEIDTEVYFSIPTEDE